jgi:8-oxo-dGTP pyrophosphatase MutT (NUDIX family)
VSRWNKDALHARFGAVGPGELAADDPTRRAAVAVVLRLGEMPHVLLMKRVEREGDPWSGQVSFPGGRFQHGDPDLVRTAIRETREELGIDLGTTARYVGALEPIVATGRVTGRPLPVSGVTPFLFLEEIPVDPVLGPEAEAAFWLPIERAAGGTYDGEMQYVHQGTPMTFPCWRFEGYVIWGLTYRMLRSLIEAVATPASPPP